MKQGIIAVDFDGTLSFHEPEYNKTGKVGEPIPLMLARVLQWLKEDKNVWIFTARVYSGNPDKERNLKLIKDWCVKYLGKEIPVTSEKHPQMYIFYDDKAIGVEKNTGILIK
jgi:hypothetical protein